MAVAHVQRLFVGLDEDLVEYVSGIIDESDDADDAETKEQVAEFLVSSEFCESDEDAAAKVSELWDALGRTAKRAAEETKKATAAQKHAERMKAFAAAGATTKAEGSGAAKSGTQRSAAVLAARSIWSEEPPKPPVNAPIEEKTEVKKKPKGKGKKEVKEKAGATERVEATRRELEGELEAARIAAVHARWKEGAYKGAIEAKDFCLPNPGGGPELLEDASFTLVRGRRYALVGRNGQGKSTLLQALAARRVGCVPEACSVHYVTQNEALSPEQEEVTPGQIVLDADVERRVLLKQQEELKGSEDAADLEKMRVTIERLEGIDSGSAARRAEELLAALGFSPQLRARKMRELSGGWRVRTQLAAALFAKPDVLLLDEPTNHLSIGAVLWLSRELATSDTWAERIIVVVSHDRRFLEDVCGDVLHISGAARRLTQTHGTYAVWAARRAEQKLTFEREQQKRAEEVAKLREYAGHGFRYGGSSSQISKMQMKTKQADKLENEGGEREHELAALQEDVELALKIKAGGQLPGNVISLRDVSFAYEGQPELFRGAELGITSTSRVVFLGENGNGKTTLVKLIMGALEATSGEIFRSPHARVALVNQHHADQLDLKQTPLQFMKTKFGGDGSYDHEQKLRGHLSSCGVTGQNPDLQNVPASALSGGQRSRVALAAVSFVEPHVLILDEPTNNLDLESVAALAACVKNFDGAVVCVSHDQYFVSEVATEAWVVGKGTVQRAESFEDYVKKQRAKVARS